jgi:hypothetical protein
VIRKLRNRKRGFHEEDKSRLFGQIKPHKLEMQSQYKLNVCPEDLEKQNSVGSEFESLVGPPRQAVRKTRTVLGELEIRLYACTYCISKNKYIETVKKEKKRREMMCD